MKISLHQFFGIIENFTMSNFRNNQNFQIVKFSEQSPSNFWKTTIPDIYILGARGEGIQMFDLRAIYNNANISSVSEFVSHIFQFHAVNN